MLQARPAMLSADGRINESLIATNAAAYSFCSSFGILDAEIALTVHQWKPKRLKLEVGRWAAGGNGAPPRQVHCGHSGHDLRDLLEAHLMKVMRSCTVHLGGQEFDLGFGKMILTIRNRGVCRLNIDRPILLQEVHGMEPVAETIRCATCRQNEKKRKG